MHGSVVTFSFILLFTLLLILYCFSLSYVILLHRKILCLSCATSNQQHLFGVSSSSPCMCLSNINADVLTLILGSPEILGEICVSKHPVHCAK